MESTYDFSGWATRNDIKCSDGRTIRKDAFKHNDGQTVPLVWNHNHNDPLNVLGHALLENRNNGVYAYCTFNETDAGQNAKLLVEHGDIVSLSIYANQLKQQGGDVLHGAIREVSLVLAGANPGALIDSVISHGEESEEEAYIYTGEDIVLHHAEETINEKENESMSEENLVHAEEAKDEKSEKTVADVFNTLNEEQKTVVYAMIGAVSAEDDEDDEDKNIEHSEGGNETMKHNVFENDERQNDVVLSHADQMAILDTAKSRSVGSLKHAMELYAEQNETLAHGIDEIESLFPEYKDVYPGAPELITRDQTWVSSVMQGTHKSPISRIRTRQADARGVDIRARGYEKGKEKKNIGNLKLLNRTTDPQTVFVKDSLHRDDILDITDFGVVNYLDGVMRMALNEEIAKAILIGDGREEGEENKIAEEHIRSILNDDELYTIHAEVDIEAARTELQGTGTNVSFGENYIYAEAIVTAALYAREQYKGSGNLDFYCTPHLLNVMLLARDMNGRRIYDSKTDLAAALNVKAIHTVEQFEGVTRSVKDAGEKELLGIFVNLADYQIGCVKGGEISKFSQFDIDFNQEKYLIETRISGALTRIKSAIVLEKPAVNPEAAG